MDTNLDISWADWASQLRWDDVPGPVRRAAENSVMDGLGVAFAGTKTPAFTCGLNAALSLYPDAVGSATVIGMQTQVTPSVAAWVNGLAMHALDFDDTSFVGILHATTVVLPAAWAAAEHTDACYEDLLLAYVAGVEVQLAFAASVGNAIYDKGHWTTSCLGVIGAAIAAGKLLGHSSEQLLQTLRLALQSASGLRSVHGTSAKPYLAGLSAKLGYEAAWAVKHGIEAGQQSWNGRYGYQAVVANGVVNATPTAPGQPYRLSEPGMAFKLYPLCSATQAAIDALLSLKQTHGFTSTQVKRITCFGTELVVSCLRFNCPASVAEAQFSMPFALATALLCDGVTVEHLQQAWIDSALLQQCVQQITLLHDPELVAAEDFVRYPEAARVEVQLLDGTTLVETVMAAKGMPTAPLSDDELKNKFLACVQQVHQPSAALDLYKRLANAELSGKVRGLLYV